MLFVEVYYFANKISIPIFNYPLIFLIEKSYFWIFQNMNTMKINLTWISIEAQFCFINKFQKNILWINRNNVSLVDIQLFIIFMNFF